MSRPRRLDDFDYLGPNQYFLTFCTRDRAPVFNDATTAEIVLSQFRSAADRQRFAFLAYCLMPDHVHALVEGLAGDSNLRVFAKSAKEKSGRAYFRRFGRPLWQDGYYEHVLRAEEDTRAIARYILENPIRAGLVANAYDYPHVGSDRWTIRELLASI